MHRGSDVIASNRSIGKSSHVVGRTTMLGICLCIRAVIWQGISGLDRWSNRLGDWKENWMRSGPKRNAPIDTVRTNQNQWQWRSNGRWPWKIWKEENKKKKRSHAMAEETDEAGESLNSLLKCSFIKHVRLTCALVNRTYLSNGWKMTVMFLAPGLHRNLVSPPSIRLSSAPPG